MKTEYTRNPKTQQPEKEETEMTDISCATWDTEEDKRMADEWAEKEAGNPVQGIPQEELDRVMPEVERALNERFDQMMEQKNAGFVERAEEIISKGESTVQIGEGVVKEANEELNRLLRPANTTPEERKVMREAGEELGLSPARYVGTADIARFPQESVKEVMAVLNHSEMPRIFTRRDNIGQVQYIDRFDLYALTGKMAATVTTDPKEMMRQGKIPEEKTLGIFILPDEKGKVPTGKVFEERLFHEVIHGNWPRIREYIQEHKAEFDKAISVQLEKKGLFPYPSEKLSQITERVVKAEKGESSPLTDKEKTEVEQRIQKETVGELSGYYFTERSQVVPEAQKWFGDMLGYFRGY